MVSKKNFIVNNENFICLYCKKEVAKHPSSSRNHCPFCLYSLHVDLDTPGDRKNRCKGLMKPIKLDYKSKKGYIIIHKCLKCGAETPNMQAPDDNFENIIALSSPSS